jgi:ABC-type branched-subunit amino acid transport system ATPase component
MQSSSVQLETNKVIEISNLSVSFNGTPVLNKIDLTVYERDFIGIIGPMAAENLLCSEPY